jgi:hypothetical protein
MTGTYHVALPFIRAEDGTIVPGEALPEYWGCDPESGNPIANSRQRWRYCI